MTQSNSGLENIFKSCRYLYVLLHIIEELGRSGVIENLKLLADPTSFALLFNSRNLPDINWDQKELITFIYNIG